MSDTDDRLAGVQAERDALERDMTCYITEVNVRESQAILNVHAKLSQFPNLVNLNLH